MITEFSGEYEFLRNDYPCEIQWSQYFENSGYGSPQAFHFPSAEHLYQALKFEPDGEEALEKWDEIMNASVFEARKIGRTADISNFNRLEAMEKVLKSKFSLPLNKELIEKLVATGDEEIIMVHNTDCYWGVLPFDKNSTLIKLTGENHMGKLLQKIRDSFDKNNIYRKSNQISSKEELINSYKVEENLFKKSVFYPKNEFIKEIPLDSEKDFEKYIFDLYINKEKRKELFNFLLKIKDN